MGMFVTKMQRNTIVRIEELGLERIEQWGQFSGV